MVRRDDLSASREAWLLFAVVIVAAVLRGIGIDWGLPETYEEATPLREAWEMWGWGAERAFDLNPHFFNYPSLIIYVQLAVQGVLYLLLRVFGSISGSADYQLLYLFDKTSFYIAGRLVTAIFGALTAWFTYRLARRVSPVPLAAVAAMLIAVNVFHIDKSQVIEVDVPLTCFVVAAMWIFLRLHERPTWKLYLLAGLTTGLAASSKYTGAALLVPFLVAHLLARKHGASWRHAVLTIAVALVAFAATSPFILLDAAEAWHHIAAEGEHMRQGHFGGGEVASWRFYLGAFGGRLLGLPLAAFCALSVVWLAIVRRRAWAVVLASFLVPYLVVVSTWSMQADRYLLPVLPIAVVVAVGCIGEFALWKRVAGAATPLYLSAVAALFVAFAVPQLVTLPDHLERMRPDTRTLAKAWIEEHIPPGALVVREFYTPRLFGPVDFWQQSAEVRDLVMSSDSRVPLYGVQIIPLFSVEPELSAVFYDIDLYEPADIVVTSSAVKGRYLQDAARFQRQAAFYAALDERFTKVVEFVPDPADGPTISIFRNPRQTRPLAYRDSLAGPVLLDPMLDTDTGEEGAFYLKMGLNFEMFGFYDTAIGYYDAGLGESQQRETVFGDLALRRSWCYTLMDNHEQAVHLLQEASDLAPWPRLQQRLRAEAERLLRQGSARGR